MIESLKLNPKNTFFTIKFQFFYVKEANHFAVRWSTNMLFTITCCLQLCRSCLIFRVHNFLMQGKMVSILGVLLIFYISFDKTQSKTIKQPQLKGLKVSRIIHESTTENRIF